MRTKKIGESWLFWSALCGPLLLSVISAALISYWIQGVYFFSVSSVESFKNFYEIFKIPLGFLTASPLTAGIAAVIHRSEETAKQIKLSEVRNNFDIYTKHRELFFNDIDSVFLNIVIASDEYKIVVNKDRLYSLFFINNTYSDFREYQSPKSSDHIFYSYLECFFEGPCKGNIQSAMDDLGIYLVSVSTGIKIYYTSLMDKSQIMNFMSLMHEQLGEKYCRP